MTRVRRRAIRPQKPLASYLKKTFGYGSFNGQYWFVGIEQRLRGNRRQVQAKFKERLKVWDKRGRKELEDLRSYHEAIQENICDIKSNTWRSLIRLMIHLEKREPTKENILEFQRSRLGARSKNGDGDHCLVDLLPLPCNSGNEQDWPYRKHFQKRRHYINKHAQERAELLRTRLKESTVRPRLVLFYSKNKSFLPHWETIVGGKFSGSLSSKKPLIKKSGNTLFVVIAHPADRRRRLKEEHAWIADEYSRIRSSS